MAVEFYNVKKRAKVQIDDSKITKVKWEKTSKDGKVQVRFGLKAKDDDGTNLTKFVKQADWEASSAKEG
ncbi:MAG TPA: hypothetical protein DCR55_16845 [Lentisphaeria bacterium]|jgi:hypothetical protein|nr:hypothetical protein [Lentisphaeria bacterium]